MQTVLFPTDFSKIAWNALPFAVDYAKRRKARLLLMHAYHVQPVDPFSAETLTQNVLNELSQQTETKLAELKAKLAEDYNFTEVELETRFGFAVEECLNVAEDQKVDLIVSATEGAEGLERALFGTNTASMLSASPAPVLVVPDEADFKPFKKMIYAIDLARLDIMTLKEAVHFAQTYDASLELVHVANDPNEKKRAKLERGLDELHELITYPKLSHRLVTGDDSAAEELAEYAEENKVDLIITAHRKRSFLRRLLQPSFTKSIAYHTEVPLLSLGSNLHPRQGEED